MMILNFGIDIDAAQGFLPLMFCFKICKHFLTTGGLKGTVSLGSLEKDAILVNCIFPTITSPQ
jgi:hypothetical protein